MGRRIDIELTSNRDDGAWTWRAAGARQPKGTVGGDLLPDNASVGDVLRADVEDFLDGLQITNVLPPKEAKGGPELLELLSSSSDAPLVTTTRVKRGRDERRASASRGQTKRDRGPSDRQGRRGDRDRDRDRDRGSGGKGRRDPDRKDDRDRRDDRDRPARSRQRSERGGEREAHRSGPPADAKPKPKRLRPGREHRKVLLESLKAEERPIAEQVLQGGIPAVREAIKKQNEELKAASKTEVNAEALLQVAERIRPKALAAAWRDRADAALSKADEVDLRDLRSVVNAAGDAGRDSESREVADKIRAALAERVEAEQAAWIAEVAENLQEDRVVRALRLSSRPPKAGQPLPGELTQQLVAATNLALTSETGQQRWATILDALAYSPIRRRVVPQSLPEKLGPELREAIAKLATRLPEIAHIFDVSSDDAPARPRRSKAKSQGKKGPKGEKADKKPGKGEKANKGEKAEPGGSTAAEAEKPEKVDTATDGKADVSKADVSQDDKADEAKVTENGDSAAPATLAEAEQSDEAKPSAEAVPPAPQDETGPSDDTQAAETPEPSEDPGERAEPAPAAAD